jgi:hypothetical protein
MLVTPAASGELVERLAPLAAAGVELVETRVLASARGTRVCLAPRRAAQRADGASLPVTAPAADLADELKRRVLRIDDRLEARSEGALVRWSLLGRELGSLAAEGGRLVGRVADGAEGVGLQAQGDLDGFLGRLLERYLQWEGDGPWGGNGRDATAPGDGPFAGERSAEGPVRARGLAGGPSARVSGRWAGGVLLTAEEIEAFRGPL